MVKEKVAAWFRRHKLYFIIAFILFGLTIDVWGYFNAPVNINRMTAADWKDTHIQKIGTITIQKLEANAPYTDIRDAKKIDGIGKVKAAQVEHYFTTWDTAKADSWFPINIVGTVFLFGGIFLYYVHRSEQRYIAKKLDEKIFNDKNVKR
ncbi:MAG: hypothetical protein M0R51_11090 [Clostridia bacterium]|jgi:hypothetical protein|nr:hypothetical protein [Clostridia bacterium]